MAEKQGGQNMKRFWAYVTQLGVYQFEENDLLSATRYIRSLYGDRVLIVREGRAPSLESVKRMLGIGSEPVATTDRPAWHQW
jgi:hypothetical protein